MKKLYSTIMMLAMMVAALSLTACGGSDDEGGGAVNPGGNGNNPNNTLTIVHSFEGKYVTLDAKGYPQSYNGYLTDRGTIFCYMVKENYSNPNYLHIHLENGEKSISDFPVGHDLGNPTLSFPSTSSRYKYLSGEVKVINNNGKGFTLEFNDYKAKRNAEQEITLNGTLFVEKEVYG